MRQPADDSTVHWLISHHSPCLNDDGPECRQVVCPGVSLISMSILDFSLFSEVNPSICYMKQLFFVRQQRIGRSRSRPCVWPGCFGCSGTHRKLGPEPQNEKTEDVLMSYPSICSARTEDVWNLNKGIRRSRCSSRMQTKSLIISVVHTHTAHISELGQGFLYMESMPNSMACGNGCAADSSSELC